MCGLVGMASKNKNGFFFFDVKAFEDLLYMDTLRGDDATGLGILCSDGKAHLLKEASETSYFKSSKKYTEMMSELIKTGKAVLGHNRKKTTGDVSDIGAHPFVIDGRYLFAHNGTLTNEWALKNKLDNSVVLSSSVDSEVLGALICPLSDDKDKFETALSSVSGAYACTWIDQKEECVYLIRNKERPLFLADTDMGYIWASEAMMIYAACSRNKIKITECKEVEENVLYKISLKDDISLTKETLTLKKAMPPMKEATHTTTAVTVFGNSGISKSMYKRMLKRWMGHSIVFQLDDYVSRIPEGNGKTDGWHVWGYSNELPDNYHSVRGILPPMSDDTLLSKYIGADVIGTIYSIIRAENGIVTLCVSEIKLYTKKLVH